VEWRDARLGGISHGATVGPSFLNKWLSQIFIQRKTFLATMLLADDENDDIQMG